MSSLVFTNPGIIDPIAMMTFGVSAKSSDTAIGMFGTGLKYAIAVLLRNDYTVTIHSGEKTYEFTTGKYETRGKEFNLVYLNGESAHFTTDLGKFWEPWMAGRELASNALDEGGEYYPTNNPEHDYRGTTIIVSGRDAYGLHEELGKVFLKTEPIWRGTRANIHPGPSNWIYYRGIRAGVLEKPSMYTYNILSEMTLTEDRTIKYSWSASELVTREVNDLNDKHLMTRIISATGGTYEHDLTYSLIPSETMKEVVGELMAAMMHVPASLKSLCRTSTLEILSKRESMKLDAVDTARLKKAIEFAKKINFHVDEFPIIPTKYLGESVLGMAIDRKIYISDRVLHMGTKMLVGTLIEEYLHIAEDVEDCSRTMQNLLMDTICSLGERIVGEPL